MIALWKIKMNLRQIATAITKKKLMKSALLTDRAKLKDCQQTPDHGDQLRNQVEC